ncbi:hypothetical protein [Arthrobacter cryoconiti]|uniref:Uncharacterized protein n=1 Tax=Arthrobacter cryoconiti TaxID=748907 RepID=A0ABV8R467_9MICC|nr:hypothetical protein [Arthrobacter cryoconiti]MCC9069332.1 hypothetical protein [Arthrobacter cryoconiti]
MRAVPDSGRRSGNPRCAVRFFMLNHLVILRPGLIVQFGLLASGSVLALPLAQALAGVLPTLPVWRDFMLCGALLLATIIPHETGHMMANSLLGRRHHFLNLGWRFFVSASACSSRQQIAVSAAGPALELAAGYLLWLLGGNSLAALGNPLGTAGAIACINAILQLLPLGPRASDGRKLWRSVILSIRPKTPFS